MPRWSYSVRTIPLILVILAVVYLGLGLGFHVIWKRALEECQEMRVARGEFVESEVFSGTLSLAFDVTFWPAYSWANMYHFGTPFATPCDHDRAGPNAYQQPD